MGFEISINRFARSINSKKMEMVKKKTNVEFVVLCGIMTLFVFILTSCSFPINIDEKEVFVDNDNDGKITESERTRSNIKIISTSATRL